MGIFSREAPLTQQERHLRLLFIDDDPILREFALVNLEADQRSISVAGDGAEGLLAIARDLPDLVLLDLNMPKVDGFEVLRRLRAEERTRRLPVIVITGADDEQSIDRAFSEGATSFIVKPINWRLLLHQIRYVDRARQTEIALTEHASRLEQRENELEVASAELSIALKKAAAASEAKSQFLAAMSHELRTPLNHIIGFSEILGGESFGPLGNPSYVEFSRDILGSGRHLLAIVNDILEFTRATDATLEEEEFDPAMLIGEVAEAATRQAAAAGVSLSLEASGGDITLRGDRTRVRRVLLNLLSNAIKYTDAGGSVRLSAQAAGAALEIAVADTGIGIAGDDIAKCLEHFGRVDNVFSREHDGVGMGLPLAKQFMELHGGQLTLESKPGVGTTVRAFFPPSRVRRQSDPAGTQHR